MAHDTRADVIARLTVHHLATFPHDITFDAALRQAVEDALAIESAAATMDLHGIGDTRLVVPIDPLWPPADAYEARIVARPGAAPLLTMSRRRGIHYMLMGETVIEAPVPA